MLGKRNNLGIGPRTASGDSPEGKAGYGPPRAVQFLLCLLLIISLPAAGQLESDPGLYRGWEVSGFSIRGLEDDVESRLKEGLALSGESNLLWTKHPLFSSETLREDVQRARLFLVRNGYPEAEITPLFEPETRKRSVKVIFQIDQGPAVRLLENTTEAFPPKLEPQAEEVLELEEGEVFTDRRIQRRVQELLRILQRSGYAEARIRTKITRPDSTSARVLFVVRAGAIYRFGQTIVRGVSDDLIEVVKRSVDIESGAVYSPEPLERAEHNLRILDLFRKIRIGTEKADGNRLNVIADLAERSPQTIDTGVGYWTVDEFRATADWKHRNLLRAGRGVGLELSYSQFLQSAAARVWKPVLFHSRTRGSITLRGARESEETYRLLSTEIELAAAYLYSIRATLRPAVTLAFFDLEARTDSAGAFPSPGPNLIDVSVSWTYNRLNDRLYPTRGIFVQLQTESGLPGFETTDNYTLIEPEAIVYAPLFGGLTFATRWRVGYALPADRSSDLLPNKRFYAGGTSSMRGYERRMLGPLDSRHRPIGGVAKTEVSAELRFPIFWRFEGAVFCDTGQVWSRRKAIRPFDQEVAAGPGLMVRTPIGPIRVDAGFPVTPVPESQPEFVLHLSVGQVY
ncbi:MAG: BamA/TamA family outer membrane protein [Candidatus Eisenbacteria bacterium]|nr:BamA/TamA family outer membrane protein [Candidatus Eisenbacteria bacterium]